MSKQLREGILDSVRGQVVPSGPSALRSNGSRLEAILAYQCHEKAVERKSGLLAGAGGYNMELNGLGED